MNKSKSKTKSKPIYVGDRNVFDVDCILERRTIGSKTEYLIKWTGYADCENSWVKESDVTPDLIESFNLMSLRVESNDCVQVTTVTPTFDNQSEGSPVKNDDSYFEEGIKNFGTNVQLQSSFEDYQLFTPPECCPDPDPDPDTRGKKST